MNSDKFKLFAILSVMTLSYCIGAIFHELTHMFLNLHSPIWEICFIGWNSRVGPAWIYIVDPLNVSEILPLAVFLLTYLGIGAPLVWRILKS